MTNFYIPAGKENLTYHDRRKQTLEMEWAERLKQTKEELDRWKFKEIVKAICGLVKPKELISSIIPK